LYLFLLYICSKSTSSTVGGQGGSGGNAGLGPVSSGTPGYNSQTYVYFADGTFMPSSAGGSGGYNANGYAGNPGYGSMMIYWK
jgi:hypothetical protein